MGGGGGGIVCTICSIHACSTESFGGEGVLLLTLLRIRVYFVALTAGSILKIIFFEALAFIALSVSKHAVVERLQTHKTTSNIAQVVNAVNLHNALSKCEPSTLCKYLTA